MANTKQPTISTYQTKMVNLLNTEFARVPNSTADIDYVNVFFDLIQEKQIQDSDFYIVKRPGTNVYIPDVGGLIRNLYYNSDFQKMYYVVGGTLHIWNVATNTSSAIIPGFFATTTGDVGFTDYLYDDGTQTIIVTDGLQLKQVDSANVVTTSASPDLPVPHQPYPVFLDGYIFLLKTDTSDLYNSNLNDPLAWTAGDFISSEIQPDQATRPIKVNNYIVVFGTDSIEYFWDAGNTSGSPLQRNDTPVKYNGYLGAYAQWGNKALFVGNNVQGEPDVFMLEDLKMDQIGSTIVTRYLATITGAYADMRGSIVTIAGHVFYILNAGARTYVYDLITKLWVRWAYQGTPGFFITDSVNAKTTATSNAYFAMSVNAAVYTFNPTIGQDVFVDFTCSGTTKNEYFDSYNQKTMPRLTVWADRTNGTATMDIQWSDDDYQTWSANRQIELYQERPSINQLGRFRRRAFRWSYTGGKSFRIKGLEVQINLGNN